MKTLKVRLKSSMGMLQVIFKTLHAKNESNKRREVFMVLDIKCHCTISFIDWVNFNEVSFHFFDFVTH